MKASTRLDRYPEIMSFVRDRVSPEGSGLRILSFGCSTGEECLTLNRYFPRSLIVGVDSNRALLAEARQKCRTLPAETLTLWHSSELNHEAGGAFDLIFCMSVLLRHPDTIALENCGEVYPFTHYDEQVTRLDRLLRVGGMLVIQNASFRFSDASISARYRVVSGEPGHDGFLPSIATFDRDNQRIRADTPRAVFEKCS